MNVAHLVILIIGILGFGLAALSFGSLAPWYRTKTGIVLFSTILNLVILLILITLRVWVGPYAYEMHVRGVVFTYTALNGIALSIVVLRIQIISSKARKIAENIMKGTLPPDDFPPK